MSWTKHIKHPSNVYAINDMVDAKVISLDVEKKKIALGIKQLLENPWETIENKYPIGTNHKGTVKHFTQYGAFVELEEGIDGLLHISDMSWTRLIKHPNELFSLGEKIEVKILEVSSEERKLGVGTKQLKDDPLLNFSSGDKVNAKLVKILDKGLVFEIDDSVEGMVSFKDLNEDDRESIKGKYTIDNSYDMIVSEVNHSMKKIMFGIEN